MPPTEEQLYRTEELTCRTKGGEVVGTLEIAEAVWDYVLEEAAKELDCQESDGRRIGRAGDIVRAMKNRS